MAKYRYHQIDANEPDIIAYLQARGAQVEKIGEPVDLLVTLQGNTGVAEVKTVRGKLRASQKAFLSRWRGITGVLRTDADCDALLRKLGGR